MNIEQLNQVTMKIKHQLDRTRHILVQDDTGAEFELKGVGVTTQGRLILRVKRNSVIIQHAPAQLITPP